MRDIHSHLLYGIDDGSSSIDESIKLLKEMEKAGTTDLMLTPHYVENSKYDCNNSDKKLLFEELKKKAEENNIHIHLYLGNEVFFTNHFLRYIKENEIKTLNNSKYLLFEFPMSNVYANALEILQKLTMNGCVPIMAHPERYLSFQKNPEMLLEYLNAGILLQGNFTTLFGKYGRGAEKTLKLLLKKKMISFLGSDTHHEVKFNEKKLRKKLKKITKDDEYAEDLLNNNFEKVINDQDIPLIRIL